VIPVQMSQQHGAAEGLAIECRGKTAQTGSSVEDEPAFAVVREHRDARRLSAVPRVFDAGRGGRTSRATETQLHVRKGTFRCAVVVRDGVAKLRDNPDGRTEETGEAGVCGRSDQPDDVAERSGT
jgi:hypothetical protein